MEWVAENQDAIVKVVGALALIGLVALRQFVKKTETKVDDQLLDLAEDVVEDIKARKESEK